MRVLDLSSRKGSSEPLAWVLCFPIWWAFIGVCLVVGLWLWSMAVNVMALNQSGQASGVNLDGESIRRTTLVVGLGGFASDYAVANRYDSNGRAITTDIDQRIRVEVFPAPKAYVVRARVVVRREDFYPRPPSGGWE